MSLKGIYVHIPYCQRRCTYCDFATFELGVNKNGYLEPKDYVDLVCAEVQARLPKWSGEEITSIYFGGGTPSLVAPELISKILTQIKSTGVVYSPQSTEITLEINPETLSDERLNAYKEFGVNRFSVGAQTFNAEVLKSIGRDHEPEQIVKTLSLLKKHNLNYTFDLLFALPKQSLEMLEHDLNVIAEFLPNHISAYCLTVPTGHPLEQNRPLEDEQVEMFSLIETRLLKLGLEKYEISNFAKPGYESKHNLLYWLDEEYLGFGLSAHSHTHDDVYGRRFWNQKTFSGYKQQMTTDPGFSGIPEAQVERLTFEEALTDFCHVSLRLSKGLDMDLLRYRFGPKADELVQIPLKKLIVSHHMVKNEQLFCLTSKGQLVSNQVFQEFLFSK